MGRLILLSVLLSILILIQHVYGNGAVDVRTGSIKGVVKDSDTKTPLAGVTIRGINTKIVTITDEKGNFTIPNIPVGNYTLEFTCPDFSRLVKTDIIVKSNRVTTVPAELQLHLQVEISVSSGYFSQEQEQPNSNTSFSYEELRRSAGSAGDISRLVSILPSVSRVNDQWNGLIVRGGCPTENAFYIDNIEIPDINHYPVRGSTGGAIGILNVDFIRDVHFYSGGFSALFGDKLSSVMDIQFREGNRDQLDLQVGLNMTGFGFIGEGPIGRKGSWMFSARKSYLDLIVDAIGAGIAPRYGDLQGKIVYDISERNKLTILGVTGIDSVSLSKNNSMDQGLMIFGDSDSLENTIGFNFRSIWKENGYSDISFSHSYTKYKSEFYDMVSEEIDFEDSSSEQAFHLRNVNYYRFNEALQFSFGVEAKHIMNRYKYFIEEYINILGNTVPARTRNIKTGANKLGVFSNFSWKPFSRLMLNLGIRADYFSFNKKISISPRASISYKISDKTSLNGSLGIFHQSLPFSLLVAVNNGKDLKGPTSYHYILGLNHLLSENTLLTLEIYDKEYRNFPIDPTQPGLFLADEFFTIGFQGHDEVVEAGIARSYGLELTIQKKLARKIYGIICCSYFRSRYKGLDGKWRERVYDNRFIFSVEGGYKPNKKWEFSLRWTYAGGIPYTPFDIEASESLGSGIFDLNHINSERNPAYHSLNIRFDKRFYFKKTNLTVFFNIWNLYNRKNVANHSWNKIEQKPDLSHQWSFIPVAGFEFEF